MFVVRIAMNVLHDNRKEAVQTILTMPGAMEKEHGCLSYSFFCDIKNHDLLSAFEERENCYRLDHHL